MKNHYRADRQEDKMRNLQLNVSRRLIIVAIVAFSLFKADNDVSGQVLLQLNLKQGWNFFSLPVTPQVTDLDMFFEGKKVGEIWIFQDEKYQPTSMLQAGIGYWVYLSEPLSVLYTGEAADVPTPDFTIGWNHFVTYENLDIPENTMGTVWTFDGVRFQAIPNQLLPGLAYWINFVNLEGINNGSTESDQNENQIPDFWEAVWNLTNAEGDQDTDSMTNLQEFTNATNPMDPDTDDDNISDGQELIAGSNPGDSSSVPPPSSLAFLDPPNSAVAGTLPGLRVALIDQFGNIVKGSDEDITISLQDNPSNGTVSGTTMMTTVNGIAEFSDLSLDQLGSGYTFAVSTNELGPVVSDVFDILQTVEAFIAGRVIDENETPIPGAKVTIPSLNTPEEFTNGDGVFNIRLNSIPANNRVCVQVVSPGFTTGEETVTIFPNETTSTTIKVKHVQATQEGTVAELVDDEGNLVIETPGRSACVIVPDPASTLGTTGNICVELTFGDPSVDQDIFPGEFAAEDLQVADEIVRLASIAFGEIRVTNMDTGELIEDLNGTATMILEIPPGTINPRTQKPFEKDDTIEIWDFDETKGMWVRAIDDEDNEIDAIVEIDATTGKLVARFIVPHFSWWNVDLPIDTHHCLTGTVVDQEGNPVANAKVTATGVDYNGSSDAFTDQNGNYCLDVMRGSTVIVGARLGAMVSQQVTVNVPDIQSTCSAPQSANNVCTPVEALLLGESTCISGTVTDSDENPISNAIVEAIGFDLWVISDANGNYCLEGLPINSSVLLRSLVFINNRFASVNASVQTPADNAKCIDNACASQNLVLDVDGACVSGVIKDSEGAALENAVIWSNSGGWTTTDANGMYCISVPSNSSETLNVNYWNPGTGILHQDSIIINDTGDNSACNDANCIKQDFTLDLLTIGCINGTVESDSGTPLAGVLVYVPGYPWGVTDSSGNFCITAPVSDNVTVFTIFTAPNGLFISTQNTVDVTGAGACPDGCARLDHSLTVGIGCITGVVQADGQPVADVRVVNSIGTVTTTDTTGAFCIEGVKGEDEHLNFYKSLGGGESISFSQVVGENDTLSTDTCESGNCFDLGVVVGNKSPTLVQLSASQSSALSGETVTVTVTATDPDDDPLSYSYSALGTIDGTGESIQWTLPNVANVGDVPISVQISDGQGGITSGSLTITVTPDTDGNRPPIIQALVGTPSTLGPNQTAAVSVDAVDPNGDSLTFSWNASAVTIDGVSSTVNWVAPAAEGSYQIDVIVSDGTLSTTASVLITVSSATSGTLTITVAEPDNLMPVADARVLLHDNNGDIVQEIITAADGIARFGDIGSPRATFTVLRQKSESNDSNSDTDWFALSAIDFATGDLIIPVENGKEDANDTIEFDIIVQEVPEETTSVSFFGLGIFGSGPEQNGSTWTFRDQRLELDGEFNTTNATIDITAAAIKLDFIGGGTTEILKGGMARDILLSTLNGSTVLITLDRDPQDVQFTATKPVQNISLNVSGNGPPSVAGFTFSQDPQTSGMLSAINFDLKPGDFYFQFSTSEDDENNCDFRELRKLGNITPTALTITFPEFAIMTFTPTFESDLLTQLAWTVEGPTETVDLVDIEIGGITAVDDQKIEWEFFVSPSNTTLAIPQLPTDIGQPKEPDPFSTIPPGEIRLWDYNNVNSFDNFVNQFQAVLKTGRPGALSISREIFELGDIIHTAGKELDSDSGDGNGTALSDHVFEIELISLYDYDFPEDPLRFEFEIEIQTGFSVAEIQLETPSGAQFTIQRNSEVISEDISAPEGRVDVGSEISGTQVEWFLEAAFDNLENFNNRFGDGTYAVTFVFPEGNDQSTSVSFTMPGSAEPIPTVTQNPTLNPSIHNTEQLPSFTPQWGEISDPAIINTTDATTGVFIEGDRLDDGDDFQIDSPLPISDTSYTIGPLSSGVWEIDLDFFIQYELTNSDGIPLSLIKASESDHEVTIVGDTGGTGNTLIGDNFLDIGNTWEYDAINIFVNGQELPNTTLTMSTVGPSTITVPGLPAATVLRRQVTSLGRTEDLHFVFDEDHLILLQHEIEMPNEGYAETVRENDPLEFLPRFIDGIPTGGPLGQGLYRGQDRDDPSDVWFGTTTANVVSQGEETITVPAGTYTCNVVRQTLSWVEQDGSIGVDDDTFWIHPVKGIIKQMSTESEIGGDLNSSTLELRSTNID